MELHQIQVTYQAEEDRLLCRTSFKEKDGSLQEIRAWLTRRLVRNLWSGIVNALETQVALDKPLAAHAKSEIVGMEHQTCMTDMVAGGGFDAAYEMRAKTYPLGETPIVLTVAQFTLNAGQRMRITFRPAQGHGFEIAFAQKVLHGFCKLLQDAVKTAQWDIDLQLPGASAQNSAAGRLLN